MADSFAVFVASAFAKIYDSDWLDCDTRGTVADYVPDCGS